MTTRSQALSLAILSAIVPSAAAAQVFPSDASFVYASCDGAPSSDPAGDTSRALEHLDVVGVPATPCVGFSSDEDFMFFRLRVAANPRSGAVFLPGGWGFEIDTDDDRRDYELLVMLDGTALGGTGQVRLAENTFGPDFDPGDPAERTVALFPVASHVRVATAASSVGGGVDHFVTIAIPLSTLRAEGLPTGATAAWAGTSTDGVSLDGDMACHDATLSDPSLPYIVIYPIGIGTYVLIDSPPDGTTSADSTPTLWGRAEPGSDVTILIDGVAVGTTTAGADGTWTFTVATALASGRHTVVAEARDDDGNVASDDIELRVTVMPSPDAGAPDAGGIDGGTVADGGGTELDGGTSRDGGTLDTGMRNDVGAPDSGPRVPGYSGGALCSAGPRSGAPASALVLLVALALLLVRRPRLAAALAAVVAVSASSGRAAAQAVELDRYDAAETAEDGFTVSRASDLGHLRWGARLDLDYAFNPLVYEADQGDAGTETTAVVEHHLAARIGASLGLFDRLVVFASLPVNLIMVGSDIPGGLAADGTSLGDLRLGARGRLFGEPDDLFALAVQFTATLPTAQAANQAMRLSGEDGVTLAPEAVLELRPGLGIRVSANLGARLRATDRARLPTLPISHELTWGIGAVAPVLREGERDVVEVLLEVYGTTTFESFGERNVSPIEAIAGARWQPIDGLRVGGALGLGLARGYGSPDFRGLLTVAYAAPAEVGGLQPGPGDADGDGILDEADRCPHDPEDDDSFEDADGCPDPDNDADGIRDVSDAAPLQPEDIDGFQDDDGAPDPDNDRDGVADEHDACPSEAEDRDSIADDDGCPEDDADADTFPDALDHCPTTPGVATEAHPECTGCPALACVGASGEIRILDRVEFATGSDMILPQSEGVLRDVLSVIQSSPSIRRLRIEGHTDDRGDDAANLDLSTRRAASVRRWLVEHGASADRLIGFGCGETHPEEPNTSAPARQRNRRVVFHIVDPAPPGGARHLEGCRAIE